MRLYHVSPKRTQGSILAKGIDPAFSKGARLECWYVTPSKLAWAILHVMQRHKLGFSCVRAYEVVIRPSKLTRRRQGIYTCYEVVLPQFIVSEIDPLGVAASYPVADKDTPQEENGG